jgi:hypothetical protein
MRNNLSSFTCYIALQLGIETMQQQMGLNEGDLAINLDYNIAIYQIVILTRL